jgi:glycosyltransferase involved in cell wall biosynthesis
MAMAEILEAPPETWTRGTRTCSAPSRRLKVALVTGSYHFIKDGVALTLNRLVAYLQSQGVRVLVFAPAAPAAFAHEGRMVSVPSTPLPLRPEYRLALGLPGGPRRLLESFAPDIIHIATPDLMGHEAQRQGRRLGVPVVASYHTRYETYLKHYGLGFLEGEAARRIGGFYQACEEVYVPSPSMAEILLASGACGNIRLWGRGVDTARFDPARRSQAWRARHGFGPDDLVVTFVSRLVREKRLATLAQSLRLAAARGVDHRVLVVGDGPDRAWLAGQLPGAVFTGFLEGEELATAYASSDLFFFPSDTETFGAVTLEAMASGLPTLCADAAGSRSLVDPGVTGFLADAADAPAFADLIGMLALSPARRRALGASARARSLTFSWDEVMAALLRRYEVVAAAA